MGGSIGVGGKTEAEKELEEVEEREEVGGRGGG